MKQVSFRLQVLVCIVILACGLYVGYVLDALHKTEKDRNPGMQAGLFVTLDQSSQSFYITRMMKDGNKEKVCIVQNRAIPQEYFENCISVGVMEEWMKGYKGRVTKTNIYRK